MWFFFFSLLFFLPSLSFSQPTVTIGNSGPTINVGLGVSSAKYATLTAAITDFGSNVTTLIVNTANFPPGATPTIASTTSLRFENNGTISCGSSTVIIRSGSENWPDRQIFDDDCSSTGSISFDGNRLMHIFKPIWWGCKGDNTDCSVAVQAMVTAINTGPKSGIIAFPLGIFPFSNVAIPVTVNNLTIEGAGRSEGYQQGTYLENNGTTPMFTTSGSGTLPTLHFRRLQMRQTNSSRGHFFNPAHSITDLAIDNCYFQLANPASSVLEAITGNPSMIRVINTKAKQAAAASVPLFNIASETPGGFNVYGIHFSDDVLYGTETSTAPIVKIENKCGACVGYSSQFDNVVLETPGGGGIHLYSLQGTILNNIVSADLTAAPSQPTIYFAKSAVSGSLPSKDMTILNSTFTEGDATNEDVKVENISSQTPLVIINTRMGFLNTDAFTLPIIIGSVAVPTLDTNTVPLWITSGGRITGIRGLSPVQTDSPQTCDTSTKLSKYADTSLGKWCVCSGTAWCLEENVATCGTSTSCG